MDSELAIILFSAIAFFILLGVSLLLFVLYYQKKHFQFISEKDSLKTTFQRELLNTQLEIQEQTLKYISQEIHDNIGQILSLAKLHLATANIDKPESLQQKIEDSKQLVGKAIQDLRDLSKSLNTDYIAQVGFARSIEYELEMIKKTGSFDTEINIEGPIQKIESQRELILFRIIQEILNNIIKHSKATLITTRIQYLPAEINISIKDNGMGFNVEDSLNTHAGLGIKNMYNRTSLIGGNFQINSIVGLGTTIQINLPI